MSENEKNLEPESQAVDLDQLLKEFMDEQPEADPEGEETAKELPAWEPEDVPEELLSWEPGKLSVKDILAQGDTVRIELPTGTPQENVTGDTIRMDTIRVPDTEAEAPEQPEPPQEGAFAPQWEPEFEQPMGEYVPPQPILFHPRSKLRELKRKLVAGPERRYYEIMETGFGKLQAAMFLSFLLVVLSAGTTVLFSMGMVQAERLKLMVFCQLFALLFSALLGSYQLIEGMVDLFRGKLGVNTMLVITFLACCADGFLCLQEERIPCCAAFSLQVFMSLWGAYHKRSTEMAMMDTLRKATVLDGLKRVENYYDGCDGLLRGEGQVEDFMDHYHRRSRPEKLLSTYCFIALVASLAIGVMAWQLEDSLSYGLRILSATLLAALPVTSFITLTRPMAILERRLHRVGAVLCGWRGVVGLSGRAVFPLTNEDLFPVGSCKLNGVKFYGSRDPDQVVAYCTALVNADGGSLVPLFEHLLSGRGGRHYTAENVRGYNGGIGGEVCGVSVLLGSLNCLKELGVEIPAGSSVSQAVYAAIDGELCGVFAVTYARTKGASAGIRTLCAYRGLRPALVEGEFMLTEEFVRSRFSVNVRKVLFPQRSARRELAEVQPDLKDPALALITGKGLAPYAFAVTGARSLRTASWIGVVIHLLGGILGIAIVAVLAILGRTELLTPAKLFLYELAWLIPGLLITEWTRYI